MPVKITATSTLSGWAANRIRQRTSRLLQLYRPALADQLKQEIRRPQFAWPRATVRRNGQIVTSPRDIVDTGAFISSQVDYQPDPLKLLYTWGGYDGPVSYAGIILRGKTNYPRRDWITPAVNNLPIGRFFAANWDRARAPVAIQPR